LTAIKGAREKRVDIKKRCGKIMRVLKKKTEGA